jgi:hypothetical protein
MQKIYCFLFKYRNFVPATIYMMFDQYGTIIKFAGDKLFNMYTCHTIFNMYNENHKQILARYGGYFSGRVLKHHGSKPQRNLRFSRWSILTLESSVYSTVLKW